MCIYIYIKFYPIKQRAKSCQYQRIIWNRQTKTTNIYRAPLEAQSPWYPQQGASNALKSTQGVSPYLHTSENLAWTGGRGEPSQLGATVVARGYLPIFNTNEYQGRGLLWAAENLQKCMAFFCANPSDPDMNRLYFKHILVSVTQLYATFHPTMCSKLP